MTQWGGIVHLHSYRIRNYRRLRDVHIELASDISIFVGSNNSGKTSATQVICAFVSGSKEKLSLYDFSSACWKEFDELGDLPDDSANQPELPSIPCRPVLWLSRLCGCVLNNLRRSWARPACAICPCPARTRQRSRDPRGLSWA